MIWLRFLLDSGSFFCVPTVWVELQSNVLRAHLGSISYVAALSLFDAKFICICIMQKLRVGYLQMGDNLCNYLLLIYTYM